MSYNPGQIPPIAGGNEEERVLTTGRRVFLKVMLGTAAVVVFDAWEGLDSPHHSLHNDGQSAQTDTDQMPTPGPAGSLVSPAEQPVRDVDEELKESPTLTSTAVDTLEVTGLAMLSNVLTNNKHVRLWTGNAEMGKLIKEYRQKRLRTAAKLVIAAPVIEETLFRAVPAIAGGKKSLMPTRGIASTYLFGKVHQFKSVEEPMSTKSKEVIDKNKVPVPQYGFGAFFWMVARRRGIKHAMVAHAVNNSVALAAVEAASHSSKYKELDSD